MGDHHDVEDPDVMPAIPAGERSTAPQSDYAMRDVATGLAVMAVGLVATFGLALAIGA